MYSEWASLSPIIAANSTGAQSESVLNKFSSIVGKDVTGSVVKQLAGNLGLTQPAEPSSLVKDEEVHWCMDVICHGLSLPLTEHEAIKDCVNVYCEWLTALNPQPRICVPKPICDDPNMYARKMINHFHNLFVPRPGEVWPFLYQDELGVDTINRQAVLCHRVLRTLQQTAQTSQILTRETWDTLLLFLLAINEVLLAPPNVKDDVGDQLCERVLSVLFEVWLLACVRSFPSPSLWKTLQESCALLRHRIALIEQWNRVNLALTVRLLEFMYGSAFPEMKILDEDAQLIPQIMTNDCVAQTWYRFLRTIGSPIALCSPQLISKTPQFMHWAINRSDGVEPFQHPCLLQLPQIFLKAIKGISSQVDAFLGIFQRHNIDDTQITTDMSSHSGTTVTASATSSLRHSGSDFKTVLRNDTFTGIGGGNVIGGSSGGIISGSNISMHSSSNFIGGTGFSIQNSSSNSNSSPGNNTDILVQQSAVATAAPPPPQPPHSPTPPLQRRLAKSFSVAPSGSQNKGITKGSLIGLTSSRSTVHSVPLSTPNSGPSSTPSLTSLPQTIPENRPPLAVARPKCNSILHLFGEWLFESAHIGSDSWLQLTKKQATEASRRPSSMIMDNRKGSLSLSQPSSLTEPSDLPAGLTIDKYESGRAEAIGTLCRIFCAKKTGEEILPVYLARFYMALQQGLKINETKECEETMASILCNSADIFRLDLDGIQVLLPSFIAALELILPDKDLKMKSAQLSAANKIELRRASIHILISIITLPLHFQTLPIRDLNNTSMDKLITFIQLKPRLINILMNALQVETDAQNTHMLLGGLLLCVQDSAIFEDSTNNVAGSGGGGGSLGTNNNVNINDSSHQTSPAPSDLNLLSSACSEKSACSITSNSSLGANSTATLGNEFPSLTISDDFPVDLIPEFELSSVYDSAHALFVRATYLVCHRLISSWKIDLNVSLAALELLSGLARMHIKDSDTLECKRAVKWICDYICYQCSRPPPAHSKDLHSTIVAAFQCTSAWLMQHPYLLQDKDCITTVLEVVELGISGSKSVGKPGEPVKYKDDKELKPASMRVRDAAETLLTIILEQVGYFPNECGAQSLSSLLDEIALYKHCNSNNPAGSVTQEQAIQKFRYFVTENSTVLALLEEPLGNDQDPQPTVTLLIRGPFGRHAWTMQLRHLPRSKSGTKYTAPNPGRPVAMNEMPTRNEIEQKFFPDGVDRVPSCLADYSIPTLDAVISKIGNDSTKQLFQLLENQTVYEKLAWAETDNSDDSLGHAQESVPPPVCHEFQAARLFLSHFGFLSIDETASTKTNPENVTTTSPPLLTILDTKRTGFTNDLIALDKLSPRTHDTLHVFYVRVGQTKSHEIIDNMNEENLSQLNPQFWNCLSILGAPVNVDEHAGWTGFNNTSWKIKTNNIIEGNDGCPTTSLIDQYRFNGEKRILYWADVGSEIAFVVPTKWNKYDDLINDGCEIGSDNKHSTLYDRSISVLPQSTGSNKIPLLGQKPKTLSLDIDKGQINSSTLSSSSSSSSASSQSQSTSSSADPLPPPTRRKTAGSRPSYLGQISCKFLLVWLESFEDHLTFPIDELLAYTRTGEESQLGGIPPPKANDCHIIFLHALNSGLLRVKLQAPPGPGRMSFAIPLVDGMVISIRVFGNLIRQTVYNMAKRRRLDNDSYQPPHVRRRFKVQEMVQKYKLDVSEPELLAHLFKS